MCRKIPSYPRHKAAGMAELADAQDLGSCVHSCRFDPCYPHQKREAQTVGLGFSFFVLIKADGSARAVCLQTARNAARVKTSENHQIKRGVCAEFDPLHAIFNLYEFSVFDPLTRIRLYSTNCKHFLLLKTLFYPCTKFRNQLFHFASGFDCKILDMCPRFLGYIIFRIIIIKAWYCFCEKIKQVQSIKYISMKA